MKTLLFIDITCPKDYDHLSLNSTPQGGTESTVTRIAENLAKDFKVYVAQHTRNEPSLGNAEYTTLEKVEEIRRPDIVIGLRTCSLIPYIKKTWPDARHLLWLHDYNQPDLIQNVPLLNNSQFTLVGVSQTHKTSIIDTLHVQAGGFIEGLKVNYVYNPVSVDLPSIAPESRDPNKLVFFSSPHKGLEQTLKQFKVLRKRHKGLKLHVANPGYYKLNKNAQKGVEWLGELNHKQVISHVQDAFAVFHINPVFPETFGIVYAEAQSLGTAVITNKMPGKFDARSEVLGYDYPGFTNPYDSEAIIKTFEAIKEKYPESKPKEEFKLSNVIEKWRKLLS